MGSSLPAALHSGFFSVGGLVFFFLQNRLGWRGPLDHLIQSCSSKVTWNRQTRTGSIWVFSISTAGDNSASLGNLFLNLTTLTVKKVFSCLQTDSHVSVFARCLLSSLGIAEKSLCPFSSFLLIRYLHTLRRSPPSLLQVEQS